RERLVQIAGIRHIIKLDRAADAGHCAFDIETESEQDLRREISQAVVSAGFALVAIHREEKRLEDVFAQLTSS
ncbi:MAG: hypothetical protein Q8P95_03180, partial [bacterium]|nr:hypothetical protein [bacterium]